MLLVWLVLCSVVYYAYYVDFVLLIWYVVLLVVFSSALRVVCVGCFEMCCVELHLITALWFVVGLFCCIYSLRLCFGVVDCLFSLVVCLLTVG